MLGKKFITKRAMIRGKLLGFHHVENGQALSGDALLALARSESFAFAYTSRLFSRWASAVRSAYEPAFIETYTTMVERSRSLQSSQ